jgi:hypothetical protein
MRVVEKGKGMNLLTLFSMKALEIIGKINDGGENVSRIGV